METAETQDRFKTVVAVMLAVVTVTGAVVAWRAAVAADEAGNADFAGLAATLNAEETSALNTITAYEHYRAFTDYTRYNELGNAISIDLDSAGADGAQSLERQMREAWDLATEIQGSFFENRYLDRDGTYDIPRELDELWADAAQQKDVNPEPHFARSDAMRAKSTSLIGILIALGASLVCFTLAGSLESSLRVILAGGGTLFLIGSLVALVIVESSV